MGGAATRPSRRAERGSVRCTTCVGCRGREAARSVAVAATAMSRQPMAPPSARRLAISVVAAASALAHTVHAYAGGVHGAIAIPAANAIATGAIGTLVHGLDVTAPR